MIFNNFSLNDVSSYEKYGGPRVCPDNFAAFKVMLLWAGFPESTTINYLKEMGVDFENPDCPYSVSLTYIIDNVPSEWGHSCLNELLPVFHKENDQTEIFFIERYLLFNGDIRVRLAKPFGQQNNSSSQQTKNEVRIERRKGLYSHVYFFHKSEECSRELERINSRLESNYDNSEMEDEADDFFYEDDERDTTYIGDYHSSSFSPISCPGESNVPFFGVEIETYQDPENCEWIYEEYGNLFSCEEDASLDSYYGIEMISQPMSWKYWKSIKENISELFSNIYEGDCTLPEGDDESYGLHVHVSRSAFVNQTALHYANILVNAFLKQCEVIARRTDSYSDGEIHYNCDYRHGYYYHYNKLGKLEKITLKDYMLPGTRYASVNNTNADTVEFRIFRTTLDPVVLYGTLEFVKNILEMANSLAMENSGNKYAKFYHIRRVSFNDLLQGDYINAYVEKYKYKEDALTESLLSMTADLNGYFCPVVCEEKKAKLLSIEVKGEKKSVLEDYDDLKFEHNFKCEDFSIKDYKKVRNLDCFYEKNEKTLVSAEQISRIKRRLQRKTEGSDPMTAAYQKLFGNTALA